MWEITRLPTYILENYTVGMKSAVRKLFEKH